MTTSPPEPRRDVPLGRALPLLVVITASIVYAAFGGWACLHPVGDGLANAGGVAVGSDFVAFYTAARMTLDGVGADVFDPARYMAAQAAASGVASVHPWAYPPFFQMLIAPLALLSFGTALVLWLAVGTLPLVVMLRRLGVALPVAFFAPPVVHNLLVGQNGALTASLILGGLLALGSGRSVAAGVLFGLLAYKPQVAVLLPIALIAVRDVRAFVAFAVTVALSIAASLAFFGIDIWMAFVAHLPDHMALALDGHLPRDRFPTVFVLVERLCADRGLAGAAQAVSTLFAWGLVAVAWRRSDRLLLRAMALAVAMPLATPFMLEYDLTFWAVPGLMLALAVWRDEATTLDRVVMPVWLVGPPAIWAASLVHWPIGPALVAVLLVHLVGALRSTARLDASTAR